MADILTTVLRMPATTKGIIEMVGSVFADYKKRLVSLHIHAGSPVVVTYVGEGEEHVEPSAYDILMRAGTVEEYDCEEGRPPAEVLEEMLFALAVAGMRPICILASGAAFWKWVGVDANLRRKMPVLYGHEVIHEATLPETVVIVAGGVDPSMGVLGISYGLKYTW